MTFYTNHVIIYIHFGSRITSNRTNSLNGNKDGEAVAKSPGS